MTKSARIPIETRSAPAAGGEAAHSRSTPLRSHRNTAFSGLFAVVIALLVAACGGGDGEGDATTNGGAESSGDNEVVMENISFQPGEITVDVGTEVTWTNDDGVIHTTTSQDTAWDSGELSSGETFSHTFDEPGTYPYVCQIHPNMQATITVEE